MNADLTLVEIDLGSSASIRHEDTSSVFENDTDTAKSFSRTYTLLEAQQYSGTFKTDVALKINMLAQWNTGDNHAFVGGGRINVTAKLLVGSTTKVTASDYIEVDINQSIATSSKSVTIPIQDFTLSSGTAVTLQVTATISALNVQAIDFDYTYRGSASMSVHTDTRINPTFVASFYKDNIYSDGLLMSATGNQYFGIDPQKRDGSLFRAMCGANNGLRMTLSGLQFQEGSSSWYHLNPLALIVRLTYSSQGSAYSANAIYNPRNLYVAASRNSTGNVKFTHSLGHTSYTIVGNGCTSSPAYVSFYDKTINYCTVSIQDDSSGNDFNVEILVYDYSTI